MEENGFYEKWLIYKDKLFNETNETIIKKQSLGGGILI